MTWRNILIALLIVFALGAYTGEESISPNRPLAGVVNRLAKGALKWFVLRRMQDTEPQAMRCDPTDESGIDHSRSL